jgi:hypothetical protein
LSTYSQGNGAPPYTPSLISSSACTTFASRDIFAITPAFPGGGPTASVGVITYSTPSTLPLPTSATGGDGGVNSSTGAEPTTASTTPSGAQQLNLGMGLIVSVVSILFGAAFVL